MGFGSNTVLRIVSGVLDDIREVRTHAYRKFTPSSFINGFNKSWSRLRSEQKCSS